MGSKLKKIREEKNMTQEELEKKSGVSRQTISAIENNDEYQPKVGTLMAIAKALETTVDSIFFEKAV